MNYYLTFFATIIIIQFLVFWFNSLFKRSIHSNHSILLIIYIYKVSRVPSHKVNTIPLILFYVFSPPSAISIEAAVCKTLMQESLSNKVTWVEGAALLKMSLWNSCFPVNFPKLLKTSFSQNALILTFPLII